AAPPAGSEPTRARETVPAAGAGLRLGPSDAHRRGRRRGRRPGRVDPPLLGVGLLGEVGGRIHGDRGDSPPGASHLRPIPPLTTDRYGRTSDSRAISRNSV